MWQLSVLADCSAAQVGQELVGAQRLVHSARAVALARQEFPGVVFRRGQEKTQPQIFGARPELAAGPLPLAPAAAS